MAEQRADRIGEVRRERVLEFAGGRLGDLERDAEHVAYEPLGEPMAADDPPSVLAPDVGHRDARGVARAVDRDEPHRLHRGQELGARAADGFAANPGDRRIAPARSSSKWLRGPRRFVDSSSFVIRTSGTFGAPSRQRADRDRERRDEGEDREAFFAPCSLIITKKFAMHGTKSVITIMAEMSCCTESSWSFAITNSPAAP
jgi:hypothetical protein